MKLARLHKFLPPIIAAFALGACAATKQAGEWRNVNYSGAIDEVLVVAAIERSTQRRVYEDLFAETLAGYDVEAIPGYTLMTYELELSREIVETAIRTRDIDAVLVTRLLGVENVEVYEPPTRFEHHRSYYRYYEHALSETGPGYYRRFKVLTLETNLYDTATRELIWSMQSEAIEPSTPRHVIEAQIALTIERLNAQGLLSGKP